MSLWPGWLTPTGLTGIVNEAIRIALTPIEQTIGRIISVLDGLRTRYLVKLETYWVKFSGEQEANQWDGIPVWVKNQPTNMATARIETLCKDIQAILEGGKKASTNEVIPKDKSLFYKVQEVIQKIDGLPDLSKLGTKDDLKTSEKNIIEEVRKQIKSESENCACKKEIDAIKDAINQKIDEASKQNKKDTQDAINNMPKPAPPPRPAPAPSGGGNTSSPINPIPPQTPFTIKDLDNKKSWQDIDLDPYKYRDTHPMPKEDSFKPDQEQKPMPPKPPILPTDSQTPSSI